MLEPLEDRRLLAATTETFTGPSLSGLIAQAYHGKNTAQAAIKTMLSALRTQLTNGPLEDLSLGTVDGNGFVTEAQSLVASYNQNVDQQLLPHFTHIDNMLKLQGQQVVANLVSLNQQSTVKLISSASLLSQAGAAINTLTGGPIYSLNTPVSAYVTTTRTFETDLGAVAATLTATTPPTLTLPEVSTTIQAEAEAYRASMDAGLQVTHTNLSTTVNAAVTTLESSVIAIANANSSTAESDIHAAIATFDSAILDTTGLFGLNGPVNQVNSELGYVPHNLTAKPTATTIDGVSGKATGGTATLTATLNSATGTGLGGKVVSFTLDGGFAGTTVTDSSGVATLTPVPTNDAGGTYTGVVVASFTGDSQNLLSQNSGNLSVAPAVTGLSPTSGPVAGGTEVTITGTGFTGATGVDFGPTAATDVTVANDTTITADSPAGAGVVDVTVTTPDGTSATSAADQFTYVVAPTVTSLSPTSGPAAGGTSVTITGTGFTDATGVDFGPTAATDVKVVNSTEITADSPAGTGVVDVTVTTPGGKSATSAADQFKYT
ncbi:MAG: IPT/TIG domain-containing protein [Isosphaeraceae bacterium]